ncbi:MAG: hypothetical protein P4K94_02125 [Terracidiphilus sp.]|nr:hypothetical protein [Terracidiphilus sp.]
MEMLTIPNFENEVDEANCAYENREELAAAFMRQYSRDDKKQCSALEGRLLEALQTKDLTVAPEELSGHSLVSVLRERLGRP